MRSSRHCPGWGGRTFLLAMLRSSSALLRSSPWPASSRSSSTRLSRSSCWNSKSSKSFVSVSRASASLNDSDKRGSGGAHDPTLRLEGQATEGRALGAGPGETEAGPCPHPALFPPLGPAAFPGSAACSSRKENLHPQPFHPSLSPPSHSTDPGVRQVLQGPGAPGPPLLSSGRAALGGGEGGW